MELSGKHVTISIPKAELLYCKVDSTSLDENAYIVDKDSATITAEDSKAILTQGTARSAGRSHRLQTASDTGPAAGAAADGRLRKKHCLRNRL